VAIVYIGAGSNTGDRQFNLNKAARLLAGRYRLVRASSVYETEPEGFKDQPDFLNCVLGVETDEKPQRMLAFLKGIEREMGRAESFRNAPRVIDLDILFYNDGVINWSNAGRLPRPDNIGARNDVNMGAPRPDNIGARNDVNMGAPRPDNIGARNDVNMGAPHPDNIVARNDVNMGAPRPDNIVARNDVNMGAPRPDSIGDMHLTVPHPRAHERRFVLVPMAEIAPQYVHPTLHKTMKQLLDECKTGGRVEKRGRLDLKEG